MLKNIVFDIGHVLIDFDWDRYVHSLFDEETARRVTGAIWETGYWFELDRAILSEDEILELFYSAEPALKEEIRMAYDRVGECVGRRDWVVPLIDGLSDHGYRIYYLSDMSEHVINSNRDAFDFAMHMNGGIYSCHVNVTKPDPEIYFKLFRRYDLLPEECIFIDDKVQNIEAGRSLGMQGIVFCNKEQMKADLGAALGISLQ